MKVLLLFHVIVIYSESIHDDTDNAKNERVTDLLDHNVPFNDNPTAHAQYKSSVALHDKVTNFHGNSAAVHKKAGVFDDKTSAKHEYTTPHDKQ